MTDFDDGSFDQVDWTDHYCGAVVKKHNLKHEHHGNSTFWRDPDGKVILVIHFNNSPPLSRRILKRRAFDEGPIG